jgi:PAP2 superfamily
MRYLLAFVLLIGVAAPGRAQSDPETRPEPSIKALPRDLLHDAEALASRDALIWSVVGAGATLLTHPLDDRATVELERAQAGTLHDVFVPGTVLGETTVDVGLALTTYVFGRATHRSRVEQIGLELARAQLLTEGMVQGLKFATRRERPDLSDRHSLPSGHSALMFATATVLERRFGWVHTIPAYALAGYVAAARVTTDRHYVSDAVAGAFVGIIAARTVTRDDHHQAHLTPVFGRHGAALVWTMTP